jgi:hypothetical protein
MEPQSPHLQTIFEKAEEITGEIEALIRYLEDLRFKGENWERGRFGLLAAQARMVQFHAQEMKRICCKKADRF